MAQKPSIPKGTRDFNPQEMMRRNYIFDTIKSVYKSYGYQPIETPSMENLGTLMGKYGEEGDRLIFKILNSGDYTSKVNWTELLETIDNEIPASQQISKKLTSKITEKALRYDLTVPFARFVVQHRNDITFPFKRYQIQPVWRADRPQKGRYREFYQCDADVIGSNSLLNELELLQIIRDVFTKLGINASVKLNNRKILAGIAEIIGQADKIIDITVAIDKLDKIGLEKVNVELSSKGLPDSAIEKLQPIIQLSGNTESKLAQLEQVLETSKLGLKGVSEMKTIFDLASDMGLNDLIELDLTLARGLNYYTGAIIEVKALDVQIGSICGGGRYDDLTGIFGLSDVSGVGISFGADRIYDVLDQLDAFPANSIQATKVLFLNFGQDEIKTCLPIASSLRQKGIAAEVYPDSVKMKKQLTYANNHSIPYVIMAGQEELASSVMTVKNMDEGTQHTVPIDNIINYMATELTV